MRHSLDKLEGISPRWRWAALVAAALVVALLVWFFFRDRPGSTAANTPPQRPALGKTVTYEQYTDAINDALSDVRASRSLSGDERKKKLQNAATALERVEGAGVLAPGTDNNPAEIDNTLIISELRGDSPDVDDIESSLSALSDSLQGAEQTAVIPGTAGGERALSELNDVMSDPLFDYERDLSPLQRLARRLAQFTNQADPGDTLWRWFISLVAGIITGALAYLLSGNVENRWARLGLSVAAGLFGGVVFYAAVGQLDITAQVLAVVGLAVAVIAATLIFAGLGQASAPGRPHAVSELAAALGMTASEARRKAEEVSAAGDYRLGIRYRCLALLLALDEAGRLVFDRSATNREYLFRAEGALHDDLQPLLDRFDAVWYGEAPVEAEDYRDYDARASAIEAQVRAEARARSATGRAPRSAA